MQEKDPKVAYRYVMNSHPRGRSVRDPINNVCNRPSRAVTIDMYTNCMLCICDGWLPNPVGEITDFEHLEDIWTNPIAQTIQQDLVDKKFTWCAVDHCGIKHHDNIETMYQLIFGIDDSCNLSCPSCRRDQRMYVEGPLFDKKLNAVKHTIKLLEAFEPRIHITLACSGDPLASHIYRPFMHSYKAKPSQTFTLFTNGLLLKKQLEKTSIINAITRYQISVDAGSAEVYPEVRHGGDWNVLMENFEFLQSQGLSNRVTLEFIVQKKNFRDIPNLAKLVDRFGFTGRLTQLDNWGTWNYDTVVNPDQWTIKNGTFKEHNVLDQRHELYTECKEIVQSVLTNKNLWFTPRLLNLLDLQNSR